MPLAAHLRTRATDASRCYLYDPNGELIKMPDKDASGNLLPFAERRTCYIDILSRDSKDWQRPLERFADAQKPNKKSKSADAKKAYTDALVNCTTAWLLPDEDGNELPLDPQTARDIYTDPETRYIVDQLDEHMADRSNYLGESFAA